MKKYIWAIAACIMIAGVVTFIACNKDKSTENTTPITNGAKSCVSTQKQLTASINRYWKYCHDAYKENPEMFVYICGLNNMSEFLALTEIPTSLCDSIAMLSSQLLEEYMNENPDSTLNVECFTCTTTLSDLGDCVTMMCDILEDIQNLDNEFDGNNPCMVTAKEGCLYRCKNQFGEDNPMYAVCVANCYMDLNIIYLNNYLENLPILVID